MLTAIEKLKLDINNSSLSITDLLRKVKMMTSNLETIELQSWIDKELNGYSLETKTEDLPEYRITHGELKAYNPYYGWVPIIFKDISSEKLFSFRHSLQSIGEIEHLAKDTSESFFRMDFSAEAKQTIREAIDFETDVTYMIPKISLIHLIEGVRNRLFSYVLDLEKRGLSLEILDDIISEEKNYKEDITNHKGIVYTIANIENFAGNVGTVSDNAKILINQNNYSYNDELKKLIEQIKKYLPQIEINEKDRKEVENQIVYIEKEISNKIIPAKVNPLLMSIKNTLENVVGNVVADGIIIGITKLITLFS